MSISGVAARNSETTTPSPSFEFTSPRAQLLNQRAGLVNC